MKNMTRFCRNCGSELNEGAAFCPKCGQEQSATIPPKNIKKAQGASAKKSRKLLPMLVLIILLFSVLAVGTLAALVYFDIIDSSKFPFSKKNQSTIDFSQVTENYIPDDDSVAFDKEKNLVYANNEILVMFSIDATDKQKEEVISYLKGDLVGSVPGLNMYQILIDSSSLKELSAVADELTAKFDSVIYATYDSATPEPDAAYAPNDPWAGDVTYGDWMDDTVGGSNWWIEAIEGQNAWNYSESLTTISIGISDSSFDADHEDLKNRAYFPSTALKSLNSKNINDQRHGTHVAGIIGAEGDNNRGITGLVPKCELLIAPYYRSYYEDSYYAWDSSTYSNLFYLVEAGAKVINFSQGKTNFLYEREGKIAYSKETLKREGDFAAFSVAQLMAFGYDDFIIVQSSGNGTYDTGKALDAIENGWFASITDHSQTGYSHITIDDVLSHIIIVGAAEMSWSGFQCASFSNYGAQVNVFAPGVGVYSTLPGDKYGSMSGTSMAAPIVTGVCALTWSANPSLSAKQVKDIICSQSKARVFSHPDTGRSESYNMVNANLSVQAALKNIEPDTVRLEATESDFKTLIKNIDMFYNIVLFPFDSQVHTAEYVFDYFLYDASYHNGKTWYRLGEQTYRDYEDDHKNTFDPLGRFRDWFSFYKIPADEVDWILSDIFHVRPDHTLNSEEVYYYDDGHYYMGGGEGGYIGHSARLPSIQQLPDGRYYIHCDLYEEDYPGEPKGEYRETVYFLTDLVMIDGERVWTFYRFGPEPFFDEIGV